MSYSRTISPKTVTKYVDPNVIYNALETPLIDVDGVRPTETYQEVKDSAQSSLKPVLDFIKKPFVYGGAIAVVVIALIVWAVKRKSTKKGLV